MHLGRFVRSKDLLEAEIDDEIVALDRARGQVFGFNGVASDVWRLLASPRTIDELVVELGALYDVEDATCRADVKELISSLDEMGLIKEAA